MVSDTRTKKKRRKICTSVERIAVRRELHLSIVRAFLEWLAVVPVWLSVFPTSFSYFPLPIPEGGVHDSNGPVPFVFQELSSLNSLQYKRTQHIDTVNIFGFDAIGIWHFI